MCNVVHLVRIESQSPQAGQFNSYDFEISLIEVDITPCLNPLKRVNSILTRRYDRKGLVSGSSRLNPLKRVNSILTETRRRMDRIRRWVSIPSSGSIQFLR